MDSAADRSKEGIAVIVADGIAAHASGPAWADDATRGDWTQSSFAAPREIIGWVARRAFDRLD